MYLIVFVLKFVKREFKKINIKPPLPLQIHIDDRLYIWSNNNIITLYIR